MASHNGSKYSVRLRSGVIRPQPRALMHAGNAIVFELPNAVSSIKTTAREIDAACIVARNVSFESDMSIPVTGPVDVGLNFRVLVVSPLGISVDTWQQINGVLNLLPDARIAVFGPVDKIIDFSVLAVHPVTSDADTKSSIYVYLFRESHEIQV